VTALSPVQRALGLSAGESPFEVLGLERAPATPGAVREAARRRFERLAAPGLDPHDVIAAQEAVAAAEALLRDPDVQLALLEELGRQEGEPAPPAASAPSAVIAARAALAREGGWNRRSAQRIAALAARANASPHALVRAAAAPPPRSRAPRPPAAGRPAPSAAPTTPAPRPEAYPAPPIVRPVIAAALATAASLAALAIVLTGGSPAPVPSDDAKQAPVPARADTERLDRLIEPIEPTGDVIASLLTAMEEATAAQERRPADAAWRMDEALTALAPRWTRADERERQRAIDLTGRFLASAAPGSGSAERVVTASAFPAGESPDGSAGALRARVWAAGLTAALAGRADIPEETRDALLVASTGSEDAAPFDQAARASLGPLGRELATAGADGPEVWDAWATMLDDLTPGRVLARQRQTLALETLEAMLLGSASPSRGRAALHGAELLVERVGFTGSRAALARSRFLAWLDDPRVASIDLALVMRTARLPEFAQAELTPSAPAEERAQLRRELLTAWGMSAPPAPSERLASDWRSTRERVASLPEGGPLDRLRRAAANARLVAAASLAWRGEPEAAGERMRRAPSVDPPDASPAPRPEPSSDGRWTVEYATVRRSGEAALEAMERAAALSALGPIDARTLVRVALTGTPPRVRVRAQEIVTDRADETHLVEALLEQLPTAPRTPRVAAMIDAVTSSSTGDPRADEWELRARRAVVSRLALALDPDDLPARAAALADVVRAALGSMTPSSGTSAELASAAAAAADDLLGEAERLGVVPAIDAKEARRTRDGRRRVADGPIQRAVAETTAIAEALAALTKAERPASSGAVRAVEDDLARLQRRAAASIEQLDAALAAAAALWGLRLGYAAAEVGAAPPPLPDPVRAAAVAAAIAQSPPPTDERLVSLDPSDPAAYLRLAEELAYEAGGAGERALARRLALLAASLARDGAGGNGGDDRVAVSACLLLADLSPDGDQRRWLRALADSFGARDGLLRWDAGAESAFGDRLAAAETLGLARAEENREARERYERPGVRAALERVEPAIPGGLPALEYRITHAPSCPECKNARVVRSDLDPSEWRLCYTCDGLPRPGVTLDELVSHVRAERRLLGDEGSWDVAIAVSGVEPLRDLTLEEAAAFYNVDLSRPVFRDGAWVAP